MKRIVWLLVALCLMLTGLTGCGQEPPKPEEEVPLALSDKELLAIPLDETFSLEEMSGILGVTVTGCSSFDSGTAVAYQDEGGIAVAIVSVMKTAKDAFDEAVNDYGDDARATPNLGQAAYWASAGELLVYDDGYAVSVRVMLPDAREDNLLSASRQIAALLLERLPV